MIPAAFEYSCPSSISEAVSILQSKGFKAGSVSGPANGTPKSTSPGKGTMVAPGSTIDIRLG